MALNNNAHSRFRLHKLYPSKKPGEPFFYAQNIPRLPNSEDILYGNFPLLLQTDTASKRPAIDPRSLMPYLQLCTYNQEGHMKSMHPIVLKSHAYAHLAVVNKLEQPPVLPYNQCFRKHSPIQMVKLPILPSLYVRKLTNSSIVKKCKSIIHVSAPMDESPDCRAYLPVHVCSTCWRAFQRPNGTWIKTTRIQFMTVDSCNLWPPQLEKLPLLYIFRGMMIHFSTEDAVPLSLKQYYAIGVYATQAPIIALLSGNIPVDMSEAFGAAAYFVWQKLAKGTYAKPSIEDVRALMHYGRMKGTRLPASFYTHDDAPFHKVPVPMDNSVLIHSDCIRALKMLKENPDRRSSLVQIEFVASDFTPNRSYIDAFSCMQNARKVASAIERGHPICLSNSHNITWHVLYRILVAKPKSIVLQANMSKMLTSQYGTLLDLFLMASSLVGIPAWRTILFTGKRNCQIPISTRVRIRPLAPSHQPLLPEVSPAPQHRQGGGGGAGCMNILLCQFTNGVCGARSFTRPPNGSVSCSKGTSIGGKAIRHQIFTRTS